MVVKKKIENFNNKIIKILDQFGIIICKSNLSNNKKSRENEFYFVLPHSYFIEMQSVCKLIRIKQIGIKQSNKEKDCYNILKNEFDDLVIQFKIPNSNYTVDYYSKKNNLVIEFLGDKFHGNLEIYPKNKFDSMLKKTYGEINKDTFERFDKIYQKGYKIKYIWENDWNNYYVNKNNDIKNILKNYSI